MSKKQQLIKKIADAIQKSELGLIDGQKADYQVYLAQFTEYKTLTDVQKVDVVEKIVKDHPVIGKRAVQNKIAKMVTADEQGIDITKYVSFNAIYEATKKLKNKTGELIVEGDDKGKVSTNKQAEKAQELKETGKKIADELAVGQIVQDEKVIELLAHCIEQGYDLELVSKAITKMAKSKK